MHEEKYIDVMDDSTWTCDYHSRCYNKVIKRFLQDMEDISDIETLRNKWDEEYQKNEEDDK